MVTATDAAVVKKKRQCTNYTYSMKQQILLNHPTAADVYVSPNTMKHWDVHFVNAAVELGYGDRARVVKEEKKQILERVAIAKKGDDQQKDDISSICNNSPKGKEDNMVINLMVGGERKRIAVSSIDDLPAQVEADRLENERTKPFSFTIGIFLLLATTLTTCAYHLPDFIDNLILPKPPSPETSSGQPRQWGAYNDSDCSADGSTSRSNLHVDDEVLVDLNNRLQQWRPPGAPMEHNDDSWDYGIDSNFLSNLVMYWKDNYNWRKYETILNVIGLSETVVDGLLIRFHHIQRGEGNKAILLLHGWPGSIIEFHTFIQMIQQQKDLDEYSIVCPSLPGYGFSSAPTIEGYNIVAMAGTISRLMEKLDYNQYIIQGGDWGSMVAQSVAYLNPPGLVGLHLNFFPVGPSPGHLLLDKIKVRFFDDKDSQMRATKARDFAAILIETGYLHQQATKPETLGYALSDSPVGLCSWIGEKFQSWSDPSLPLEEKFNLDDLLTNCMIYWVTNSITSSMRLYKEQFRTTEGNAVGSLKVEVPVALSLFPHEIFPPADAQLRRKFQDIVLFRKHTMGGHFAALEQPDLLVGDLVDFVNSV